MVSMASIGRGPCRGGAFEMRLETGSRGSKSAFSSRRRIRNSVSDPRGWPPKARFDFAARRIRKGCWAYAGISPVRSAARSMTSSDPPASIGRTGPSPGAGSGEDRNARVRHQQAKTRPFLIDTPTETFMIAPFRRGVSCANRQTDGTDREGGSQRWQPRRRRRAERRRRRRPAT